MREPLRISRKSSALVVVPVENESTEVTAPTGFMTTITVPLAERGYYAFPVYLTEFAAP
jgi:hypothetical protein